MSQQLIDGIQFYYNLTIMLANTKFKDDKLGDWLGAVSYMATKVTESFGVAKVNKNPGCRGKGRIISAVEVCGRGHVSRGWGRGRGRGQGCGCSNGVDFQYFKQFFHPSEMQHMSSEGNSYIAQKRTEANNKIYGDEYRYRRYVKETAAIHCDDEEEEDKNPAKKPKLDKEGRNGNAFRRANNGKDV